MKKFPGEKRGRQFGQIVNPRDERGWMIPRPGSQRRKIYDLMVLGWSTRKIRDTLGLTRQTTVTERQKIMAADRIREQVRARSS